jgi:hypothetical protein
MKLLLKLLSILVFTGLCTSLSAQKKDSTYTGKAKGIVRDSVYNYVLPSATIAVYKMKDSSLVSYQLSNNVGEFHFSELPVNIPLRMTVSYIGYKSLNKKFTIPAKNAEADLRNLNLDRTDNVLNEVVINATPPPVRMNGDTIEFNANAFSLDRNAVAEDLLRRLPGITVWGDGTITFNGKQIRQVLVEGKPFFGGDSRLATQNIPKDAIDKIQVYQQQTDRNKLLDSVTDVNIKLKKSKKFGHFGKIAAGYGTKNRYETDGNINYFNSNTQLGLVASSNNTNKVANDVGTLMRNSTFKGTGANVEYQSDFSRQGIYQPNSGGFVFQHDFIPNPDFLNNNRLTANYFVNNYNNTVDQNTQTLVRLAGDSTLDQKNNSHNKSDHTNQSFDTRYNKQNRTYNFYVAAAATTNKGHDQTVSLGSAGNVQGLQSNNNATTDSYFDSKGVSFETGLRGNRPLSGGDHPLDNFDVSYSINAGNEAGNKRMTTSFISFVSPDQNKVIDRRYDANSEDTRQHLFLSLGDLAQGVFARKGLMQDLHIEIKNNLDVNLHHEKNNVYDKDTLSGMDLNNAYLSNNMKTVVVNERPALAFGRAYQKFLANRYLQSLNINFSAEAQYFSQKNTSDRSFQNFNKNYGRFLPGANISYRNDQFGDFEDTYIVNFATSVNYPTAQQLVPLTDSINQYNIQQGNATLKPATTQTISFDFKHINRQSKNSFDYALGIEAGLTSHTFADSVLIDDAGRYTHYTVNAGERKNLGISGSLNKAFKFHDHQIQININTRFDLSRNPGYINTEFVSSDIFSNDNKLNLYYTYKDLFAIEARQGYSYYHSRKNGNNSNEFSTVVQPTTLSTSVKCTGRLTVGSNVTYNHTRSTGLGVTNFTIWNANASYRFMKGNNLELKISALDLLHQNSGIINYGTSNSITRGTTNVLQQYGLITLSYFPRQFGKTKKEK